MNKRILITGAASGIGFGIAKALASQGHHIILTDLDQNAANAAAEEISELGYLCDGFALNVASETDIASLFTALGDLPIDVLINSAGIQHVSSLEAFPAQKWQLLVDVMLTGAAMITKAVLPKMRQQNFGRIINIGSIHGLVASKYKSAYVAAKHGLIGFSKVMALETAEYDVTINTICPAYVKTPLVEKQIAAQAVTHGISELAVEREIMLAPMPKKAFISIEEIVHTVTFLMADGAKNMTGQALVLDGGWTVQ